MGSENVFIQKNTTVYYAQNDYANNKNIVL